MQSAAKGMAFLGGLLGALAEAQDARADEEPYPADQTQSDAGADSPSNLAVSDAGVGLAPDLPPSDISLSPIDGGHADIGAPATHPNAGSDARKLPNSMSRPVEIGNAKAQRISPVQTADALLSAGPSKHDEVTSVAATATAPPSPRRLPILGLMADVGVPDGLIGSLAVRPRKWVRLCAGGGSNSISRGWRTGITLLPFGEGPSASLEYGRYQDGNANALAKKLLGGGFDGSPVLERVGYEYMNAHLGLDFGFRRIVFFVHGGITMLRGQIHNLNAAISGTGSTQVVVPQDPNAKAVGPSVKLGLIVYIW